MAAWVLALTGAWSCGGGVEKIDSASGGGSGTPGTGGRDTAGTGGGGGGATAGGTGGFDGGSGASSGVDSGVDGGDGSAGTSGAGGSDAGACCPNADCLCRGPTPTGLTSAAGPFAVEDFRVATGTIHFPTDAEPPFASVAMIARGGSSAPEFNAWGSFFASHGMVTLVVDTASSDLPAAHATKLLQGIEQLKAENARSGSPLFGKLSDRYGVAGYSLAAAGSTLAASTTAELKTSIALAVWEGTGTGVRVPTLLFCGEQDPTAPCSMSQAVYAAIPEATPKMMVSVAGANHSTWYSPVSADRGTAGETVLAFQKVFLEGDARWLPLLRRARGTVTTNIP